MFKISVVTTMGHILEFNHSPQTIESAKKWATELRDLLGNKVRHVIIAKTEEYNLKVILPKVEGAGQ